jgi:hypothetical protein
MPSVQKQNRQWKMGLPEALFGRWLEELGALAGRLPLQLIHRDPHPGNILFSGGEVSGFLRSVRLWDPCYCATGLLSEWRGTGQVAGPAGRDPPGLRQRKSPDAGGKAGGVPRALRNSDDLPRVVRRTGGRRVQGAGADQPRHAGVPCGERRGDPGACGVIKNQNKKMAPGQVGYFFGSTEKNEEHDNAIPQGTRRHRDLKARSHAMCASNP